jgi:hypothetical protein
MRLAGLRGSCLVRDLALTASRRAERAGRLDQPSALQTRKIAGLRSPRRLTSRRIKVLWNSPERLTHSTLDTPDLRRYLRCSIARICTMGSALEWDVDAPQPATGSRKEDAAS